MEKHAPKDREWGNMPCRVRERETYPAGVDWVLLSINAPFG